MKITKRQLRRIIKEEKIKVIREQQATTAVPTDFSPEAEAADEAALDLQEDMADLINLVAVAEAKAGDIVRRLDTDDRYNEAASGREASDLSGALERVWTAFGGERDEIFK